MNKNIHIIPTDKPSRLALLHDDNLHIGTSFKKGFNVNPQNIYITSDEEIKEEDWACHKNITNDKYQVIICTVSNKESIQEHWNKIILTTDPDLIASGVQPIEDDFLEWFVKNPSCEFVDVNDWLDDNGNIAFGGDIRYKIIIPQEEPKQETLEEAAMSYLDRTYSLSYERTTWQKLHEKTFAAGAKWQAERMYSEEEVISIVEKSRITGLTAEYLLLTEQFKKK